MKFLSTIYISLLLSISSYGQSPTYIGEDHFKFIGEVVKYASDTNTDCVLKYLDHKEYTSAADGLKFYPLHFENANLVVEFVPQEVQFILATKEGSLTWNTPNEIYTEIIDLTGIAPIHYKEQIEKFTGQDTYEYGFQVLEQGEDYIEVFFESVGKSRRFKRSNLMQRTKPEIDYNVDGSLKSLSVYLLYFLGETTENILLRLNIFSSGNKNEYFVDITAQLYQPNLKSSSNCSGILSASTATKERPVLNANPLDFANGYNINSYDLQGYLEVFYMDLYFNAPGYFGKDIAAVAFKAMQSHKSKIYFKDIPVNQRNEASNVLAYAWGMFDDCKVEIQVNPKEWHKADNVRRLWIIYHELCHDVFNLEHECGIALMNPTIPVYIDETMFLDARDELLDYIYANDLFSNSCPKEFQALDRLLKG